MPLIMNCMTTMAAMTPTKANNMPTILTSCSMRYVTTKCVISTMAMTSDINSIVIMVSPRNIQTDFNPFPQTVDHIYLHSPGCIFGDKFFLCIAAFRNHPSVHQGAAHHTAKQSLGQRRRMETPRFLHDQAADIEFCDTVTFIIIQNDGEFIVRTVIVMTHRRLMPDKLRRCNDWRIRNFRVC